MEKESEVKDPDFFLKVYDMYQIEGLEPDQISRQLNRSEIHIRRTYVEAWMQINYIGPKSTWPKKVTPETIWARIK